MAKSKLLETFNNLKAVQKRWEKRNEKRASFSNAAKIRWAKKRSDNEESQAATPTNAEPPKELQHTECVQRINELIKEKEQVLVQSEANARSMEKTIEELKGRNAALEMEIKRSKEEAEQFRIDKKQNSIVESKLLSVLDPTEALSARIRRLLASEQLQFWHGDERLLICIVGDAGGGWTKLGALIGNVKRTPGSPKNFLLLGCFKGDLMFLSHIYGHRGPCSVATAHVPTFVKRHGWWGLLSEQPMESFHPFNDDIERRSNTRDVAAQLLFCAKEAVIRNGVFDSGFDC